MDGKTQKESKHSQIEHSLNLLKASIEALETSVAVLEGSAPEESERITQSPEKMPIPPFADVYNSIVGRCQNYSERVLLIREKILGMLL